jgi:hypothetical protein
VSLERAALPGTVVIPLDIGISVVLTNLVWRGNDDVKTLITREGNFLRTERMVTADVTGTAVVSEMMFAFQSGQLDIHQELTIPR